MIVNSDADWIKVEGRLFTLNQVHLKIDQYDVVLYVIRFKMKLVITPYVNREYKPLDWIKGKTERDIDIRDRFLPFKKKNVYPPKWRQKMIKLLGKTKAEEQGYLKTFDHYDLVWKSFSSLQRKLKANSTSIECTDQMFF